MSVRIRFVYSIGRLVLIVGLVSAGKWALIIAGCMCSLAISPVTVHGADILGNVTYQGRVVDADTLAPIEGAVVVARWEKCWPGIGAGELCDVSLIKETMTDANGEWNIKGPEGTWDPGLIRKLAGFIVRWTRPPNLMVYKPRYYKWGGTYGLGRGFMAIPYDNGRGQVGIAFIDEETRNRETESDGKSTLETNIKLYLTSDPERFLKAMNFSFLNCKESARVPWVSVDFYGHKYWILGLRKVPYGKEWIKERLNLEDIDSIERLPLLREVISEDIKKPVN